MGTRKRKSESENSTMKLGAVFHPESEVDSINLSESDDDEKNNST